MRLTEFKRPLRKAGLLHSMIEWIRLSIKNTLSAAYQGIRLTASLDRGGPALLGPRFVDQGVRLIADH